MDAGAIDVIYGSLAGLSGTDSEQWDQVTPGVPGTAEEEGTRSARFSAKGAWF